MVEFANPTQLWWALLAIPIAILFILRIRLRRETVSTLMFWEQIFEDQPPRAWWQRLRNLISLALQLIFLAMVVGALVDPLWSWQSDAPRSVVYVVDNSASMSASDGPAEESRLERARVAAKRLNESLRARDVAAIVTAGGQPEVIIGLTNDPRLLDEAIDRIPAKDNRTDIEAGVELARTLIADAANSEIVVLTDGTDEVSRELKAEPDVTLFGFGGDTNNTAITAFQVRRSVADATSYQVLFEVVNFGDEAVECRLELTLEDSIVDVVPLTLEPGEPWRRTLDHTSPDGGRLVATLDVVDALAADNRAVAVLPRREPIPVLLVTPGSLFLRSVFESIPGVELTVVEDLPNPVPAGTILVVHKVALPDVPNGPVMVIDPQSDSDLWTLGNSLPQPIVGKQAENPLVTHVGLKNTLFPGARRVAFTDAAPDPVPLLESAAEDQLYSLVSREQGDVIVLAAKLEDGDLPLRIAFPVMVKNAIEFFLGSKGELRPALSAGQMTTLDVGTEDAAVELSSSNTSATEGGPAVVLSLRSPSGDTLPVKADSRSVTLGPFDETGLWLFGPSGQLEAETTAGAELDAATEIVPIAVNLASAEESDIRPAHELPSPPTAAVAFGGYSLWFYLTLAAVLGSVCEWYLYQRRIVA